MGPSPSRPRVGFWNYGRSVQRPTLLCCVSLFLLISICGCQSGSTRKETLIKSAKHVESSAAELSSRNQSLLGMYSAEIETAADNIRANSSSPVTRRQALVWKAEAIPVLQTTLLRTDPLAAILDTWAFILQMKAHMAQTAVKQGWGDSYPVVADTLNRMETEMEQLVQTAAPKANVEDLEQRIDAWAKAHPIQAGLSGRKSADADLIRRAAQTDLGAMASLKALGESLGDFTARLDSYNAYLPKQARWQAELLLSEVARDPQFSSAMSNAAVLTNALAKTSDSIERAPEFVEQERKATIADMDGQRRAVQDFLQQERAQVLDAVDRQRVAMTASLRSERLAATSDLRGEREVILSTLHQEEAKLMSDMDAARERALADFDARANRLVDRMFVRALEVALLVLVLCVLAAWILLRRFSGGTKRRITAWPQERKAS